MSEMTPTEHKLILWIHLRQPEKLADLPLRSIFFNKIRLVCIN